MAENPVSRWARFSGIAPRPALSRNRQRSEQVTQAEYEQELAAMRDEAIRMSDEFQTALGRGRPEAAQRPHNIAAMRSLAARMRRIAVVTTGGRRVDRFLLHMAGRLEYDADEAERINRMVN